MRIWHSDVHGENVVDAPGYPNGKTLMGHDAVEVTKPNGDGRRYNAYAQIRSASEEDGVVEIIMDGGESGYVYGEVKFNLWEWVVGHGWKKLT